MTTEERLDRLENELSRANRQNRRLLFVSVLAFAVGLGAWLVAPQNLLAQPAKPSKEVRANSFVVEDEKGEIRAMLNVAGGVPLLLLSGPNGKGSILLGLDEHGVPALILSGENGKYGAMLRVSKDEGPTLSLSDQNRKTRAALSVDADGTPRLRLYDKNDKLSAALGLTKGGPMLSLYDEISEAARAALAVPGLFLYDSKNETLASLLANSDGSMLSLHDPMGKQRAVLSTIKDAPMLSLSDNDDERRVALVVDANGIPTLRLYDKIGTVRAGLGVDDKDGAMLGLFDENGRVLWKTP